MAVALLILAALLIALSWRRIGPAPFASLAAMTSRDMLDQASIELLPLQRPSQPGRSGSSATTAFEINRQGDPS